MPTHNNDGLTTNATVNSTTNYAAPSAITTNSLSSLMNYSAALGVTSATGPNGDNLAINYDTSARPHTTTSPLGAVTTFTYNDSASPPTKVATTNSHWVKTTLDGLGRTIKSETGNGTTTLSVVDPQYVSCGCSPLGKMGQQSQPYAPAGPCIGRFITTTGWAAPPAWWPRMAAQPAIRMRATRLL